MSEDKNETPSLSKIAESLEKHESALEALKNIPEILKKLTETGGLPQETNKASWSLVCQMKKMTVVKMMT